MKITKIECVPLSIPTPMRGKDRFGNILLVKIHTDEGIIGIGDAGGVNQEAIIMMIKQWTPFLIGANPLDRGPIMSRLGMAIGSVWGMSYPAKSTALSLSNAFWTMLQKV